MIRRALLFSSHQQNNDHHNHIRPSVTDLELKRSWSGSTSSPLFSPNSKRTQHSVSWGVNKHGFGFHPLDPVKRQPKVVTVPVVPKPRKTPFFSSFLVEKKNPFGWLVSFPPSFLRLYFIPSSLSFQFFFFGVKIPFAFALYEEMERLVVV